MVGVVQLARHVGHHGLEEFGVAHSFGIDRLKQHFAVGHIGRKRRAKVKGGRTQVAGQHMVVQIQQFAQLGGKTLGEFQVLHAQGAPGNLVLIGRANAAPRGADFDVAAFFAGCFARHVQRGMKGQDQRAGFADAQARAQLDAHFFQAFNLFKQLGGRQDHAVADVALHTRAHDAAGDQVQGGFHAVDYQGMSGIVAALKAHHALGAFGQPIDQFALAFVAPLGSDHNDVSTGICIH